MKVYLFDTDYGFYAGETFEDADMLQYEDGITAIPPPEYGHGEVPVFDRRKNEWDVIPYSRVHQLLNSGTSESSEKNK